MKRAIPVAVAALVATSAIPAHADDRGFEVGAGLFDSIPTMGDFRDEARSSLGVTVYGDYTVLKRTDDLFTVGLEAGDAFGYESKENSSVDYLCATAGLRGRYIKEMDFWSKKGRVYAIAGISAYRWHTDPISSLDTTTIGFNFGTGADLKLSDNWLAGAEFRYHMPNKSGRMAYSLAPALKVGYTF
jgi:opacity protein-like surface antigen